MDVTNATLKKADILVAKASSSAYRAGNKYIEKKIEKLAGQPSSSLPTPAKTASQKFPSKISNRKRKAPKLSVSAKKKRPIHIQNIIEEA